MSTPETIRDALLREAVDDDLTLPELTAIVQREVGSEGYQPAKQVAKSLLIELLREGRLGLFWYYPPYDPRTDRVPVEPSEHGRIVESLDYWEGTQSDPREVRVGLP